uniref:ASCH domain-containing protein n=1 Tax=Schlesneria paludicola TaxID=360056 RepID=A0A7C4QLU0_9PLAN
MTARRHPDPTLIALGIQQPWAEFILRGLKTIEIRSQPTHIRGTVYVYTSKRPSTMDAARQTARFHAIDVDRLPKGVLVGTVDIVDSRPCTAADAGPSLVPAEWLDQRYAWVLANPRRLRKPLEVRFLPYGVWFYPFRRRTGTEPNPRRRVNRR